MHDIDLDATGSTAQRTIAVVTAGLSQPSASRLLADQLAAAAVRELQRLGSRVDVHVIEVREYARDVANSLVAGFASEPLTAALDAVAGADAVIVVAPTFRASFSGLFKSFIDVLDESALSGKPVLIGATGGTTRHSLVLEHSIRPVLTYMHAVVVPTSVFAATEDWAGGAESSSLRSRIERAARELAVEIDRRGPVVAADPFKLTTPFDRLLAAD
jgi:FMN reductase